MVALQEAVIVATREPATAIVTGSNGTLDGPGNDPWDNRLTRTNAFIEQIRRRYPQFAIGDLTPILDAMRVVKSPLEVDLLRKSTRLAALGIMEAMRSTRPGAYEYELDAAARYVHRAGGAMGEGYRSITATGT